MWNRAPFESMFDDVSSGHEKLKTHEYNASGNFPIVDQGESLICGYSNDSRNLVDVKLPVIIFGDHTRIFKYIDFPFCIGADGVKIFKAKPQLDAKYAYHFLCNLQIENAGYSRHAKFLRRKEIEFPTSLPEQRRIAAILDQADELRRKRREALERVKALADAVFAELTSGADWPMAALSDVVGEIYRYPTYYDIRYEEAGIPEIRGELLRDDGSIDGTGARFISRSTSNQFPRTQLEPGDLVMSVRGTIGKIGLIPNELAGANITANLIRISPRYDRVLPIFLWRTLKSPNILRQLEAASTSTTIATINTKSR
jgi:type I restriction enzyme, S subunit